jgi:outer membrane protein TolC
VRATAAYGGANSYGFGSDDEWQWHWNAVLSASWSIWDGGLTRATVAQKRLELLKSQTDLDDLRSSVRFEIREAFLEMTRAAETVEMCRGGVELAEKALQIARVRYDEGLTTQLEFTDANLGLGTARWSWLRALRDHGVAVTRLQHASGVALAEFQEVR